MCNRGDIMANLTISVNDSDKKEFGDFCDQVGISSSSLLNMFIKTVIREGRIPFEISLKKSKPKHEPYTIPNRKTLRALKEGDALIAAEDAPSYTLEEVFKELSK